MPLCTNSSHIENQLKTTVINDDRNLAHAFDEHFKSLADDPLAYKYYNLHESTCAGRGHNKQCILNTHPTWKEAKKADQKKMFYCNKCALVFKDCPCVTTFCHVCMSDYLAGVEFGPFKKTIQKRTGGRALRNRATKSN